MSHRCFISFKKEDVYYKDLIANKLKDICVPYNVLDKWIDSENIDYVIQYIRDNYMKGTTVTIFIIGQHSSENEGVDIYGYNRQSFIIRELRATLLDKEGSPIDGLLGVVLPEMYEKIYGGTYECPHCKQTISYVNINPSTVIKEFANNYYLEKDDCDHYGENGRFCVLVKFDDFMKNPILCIDKAYNKTLEPIAKKVKFKNIEHVGKY